MESPKDISVDTFIDERLEEALKWLQREIANDYADFMAERTGFSRDYFLTEPN